MGRRKNTRGAVVTVIITIVALILIIVWRTRNVRENEQNIGAVQVEIEQKY